MAEDVSPVEWTEKEKAFFHHEAYIAKLIRLRDESSPDTKPYGFWHFIESSAGIALITILIGGWMSNCVVSSIQHDIAQRDKSKDEYNKYLEEQQAIVKLAYDQTGKIVFAAQSKLDLTEHDISEYVEKDKDPVKQYRNKLEEKIDSQYEEWGTQKETLGLSLRFYLYGQPTVLSKWNNARESVDNFITCADQAHDIRQKYPAGSKELDRKVEVCNQNKLLVRTALEDLALELDKFRRYKWQLLETPENLPYTNTSIKVVSSGK